MNDVLDRLVEDNDVQESLSELVGKNSAKAHIQAQLLFKEMALLLQSRRYLTLKSRLA